MYSDDLAIKITDLGKCYQIYPKPSDRLKQFILPRFDRFGGRSPRQYYKDFWALRDISFEIKRGDTVGIIGRNGSGKSTLLQIICGTLTPTAGSVEIAGKVAALLELGAGFNPEFTGRENVFMNAALHGLSRQQTEGKFDLIAGFADIGEFMDQPVKTYSSGMYVRLAFAVIAHVDADILVVDEALSVGDAVFTQKCMRFIRRFEQEGTLLFVSHDIGALQNLCRSAIWLGHGKMLAQGPTKDVAEKYTHYVLQETYGESEKLVSMAAHDAIDAAKVGSFADAVLAERFPYSSQFDIADNAANSKGFQSGKAFIESAQLVRSAGGGVGVLHGGESVRLTVRARSSVELNQPIIGFFVKDRLGQELFGENTLPFTGENELTVPAHHGFHAEFEFNLPMLPDGQYALTVAVANGTLQEHTQHHWIHDILVINVASSAVRWGLVGLNFSRVALAVD